MPKLLSTIIGVTVLIGTAFSSYFFLEHTYAKDIRVDQLAMRLEQKIQQDTLESSKKELRYLKKEYGRNADKIEDPALKEEILYEMEELKETIEEKKDIIEEINKKSLGG